MQKTPFAGLTELDVSESILEDNGAFTGRDRETIDRYLQIGAKTHRHDGTAGLTNPTNAPSAAVIGSGGTIGPSISMSIGITAQDEQRGETVLSPVAVVSTPGPLSAPQHAPSAEVKYDAGSLTQDNYYYGITYVDAEGGETPLGPVVAATRQPGKTNARVSLSHISDGMVEAGAKAWRLYRQRSGGAFAYLASGTASTYMDEGTVSPICDTNPPNDNFNTTNSVNTLKVVLPSKANLPSGTAFINLYLSQTGNFSGQTFLEQFPVASAGATVVYSGLELQDDQPPDVNTSIGGAAKITTGEIEGLHWKEPVTASGVLPAGEKGDVRITTANGFIYAVLGSGATLPQEWTRLGSGTVPVASLVASGVNSVAAVEKLTFVGSGAAQVKVTEQAPGQALITITAIPTASGGGAAALQVTASGVTVKEVTKLEIAGSGGINLKETEPGKGEAKVLVEGDRALFGQQGMGVMVIKTSEKGIARPNVFKQYRWYCKEKPTNLAEFDEWIETGP